jgi:hypothetical protein
MALDCGAQAEEIHGIYGSVGGYHDIFDRVCGPSSHGTVDILW